MLQGLINAMGSLPPARQTIFHRRMRDMSKNLIYGPVPSRRLGFSLGVDLVPYKICSYDCIYCQLGPTPATTMARKPYIASEVILAHLDARLKEGVRPDFITLAGSGEPTLNSEIEAIIRGIKTLTEIPVAVLTNGSLLTDEKVRRDISGADVVLPSLDACDAEVFLKINRPHRDISFETMAEGLVAFRQAYAGKIWLEIFLAAGVNAEEAMIRKFKVWTDRIHPDKIHLNTAVRPTAESYVYSVPEEKLLMFCKTLGENAEIIAPFKKHSKNNGSTDIRAKILDLLDRRPCTLPDIASGLGSHQNEILKYIEPMISDQEIEARRIDEKIFYRRKRTE
ncbi:MAG: radical SAM protein [Desulfobacterales bacterium CG23_combo_of_CG06-09_8_20_14_all_51_8]|nr:MAG: radical SAM protein [Desulfobacterales bacterium CG23_combo_of_CG06-09_8_20_14_all_51_8]